MYVLVIVFFYGIFLPFMSTFGVIVNTSTILNFRRLLQSLCQRGVKVDQREALIEEYIVHSKKKEFQYN